MYTPEEMLWKKIRQVEKSEEMFVRQQQKKKRERERHGKTAGRQKSRNKE